MSNEFRVFGPPGCGKTTYISKQIKNAAMSHATKDIVACSFTAASAAELAANVDLPKSNVGTIHSLAYHQLGMPPIAETEKEIIQEWNELYPPFAMQPEGDNLDKAFAEVPDDCSELMEWNVQRSTLTGRRHPQPFVDLWEEFKEEKGVMDFTDLLLNAPRTLGAEVLVVDEAQDLTKLQWELVRAWGSEAETFVVAGDDDQCVTGDTLITLVDGTKRSIKTIVDNEEQVEVMSYNERTGEVEPKKVIGWHKSSLGDRELVSIGPLTVTGDHEIYTPRGWVSAKRVLNLNDFVLRLEANTNWETLSFTNFGLSQSGKTGQEGAVYCLDVEGNHNFFADDILVHNCLYSFLGATPDAFLSPLPNKQKRVLHQSYRVPEKVMEVANNLITTLGDHRQPKRYEPRKDENGQTVEGDFGYRAFNYKQPEPLIREVEDRVQEGESVMILGTCGYHMQRTVTALREAGLPFHNPYRRRRGDWNPLRSTAKRIASFLDFCERFDTPIQAEWIWEWAEMLRASDTLQYGAKTEIGREAAKQSVVGEDVLLQWFTEPLLQAIIDKDVEWLHENMTSRFKKSAEYPIQIAKKRGIDALREEPQIIVGTIHSVKGGEADTVFIYPDISMQAWEKYQERGNEQARAIIRAVYVGMTRARENLYICEPAGALNFTRITGGAL